MHYLFVLSLIFTVTLFHRITSAKTNNVTQCKDASITLKSYLQLKRDVLCNYDKYTRPGYSEKNTTQITIFVSLQLVQFVRICQI